VIGVDREDLAEESKSEEDDEDHIEEVYEQLWTIPNPVKPRVPNPAHVSGSLMWVHQKIAFRLPAPRGLQGFRRG
jgi:hypothetical protein